MSETRQALAPTPRGFETYSRTASLAFFPDGKQAVHVSECELATLLHVEDGCRVGSWKMAACVAAISKDGKWIICGCSDGKVRILDAESQAPTIVTNDHHARKVSALDVSTNSSTIASGASDGSVCIWSVATGERLDSAGPFDPNQRQGRVTSIQFSRGGDRLAGCTNILLDQYGAVFILNIHDNQLTQPVVVTFNCRVTAVSWLPDDTDGQRLRLLAGLEESLAVIDPSDGTQSRKPIPGFRALSENGRFLVSSSRQDGVRFWNAAGFAEIGHNLPSCLPIAISPNNRLVTVSQHAQRRSVSIWDLSNILPEYYVSRSDDGLSTSPLTAAATRSGSQILGFGGHEADETLTARLSKMQLSADPEVHRQYQLYASPSQRKVAESIITDVLRQRPPVLIDTQTGHLCHGSLQILTLEAELTYNDLVSCIGEGNLDRFRQCVEDFFSYVMFSHKWDETCKEPLFHDVVGKSVYDDLEPTPTHDKLRNFCRTVRETGHRWAWSDTCCIKRTDSAVLSEAIVSMYRWYRESALTLALLASVASPSIRGNLGDSVWMTRAWTLQELLAPKAIRFYDSQWKPYLNDPSHNHRDSPVINEELASAIHVSSKTLSAFRPGDLGVREKLRLASTRVASVEEDVAYSLFGIFASDLQPKYGERKDALGRLLEEIVHRSGDVTVLAWTGKSSQFNSCLPAEIVVYKAPPEMVSSSDANKLKARVVELHPQLSPEGAVDIYRRITDLPKASFVNRRLRLPCIVFAVHKIALTPGANSSQLNVYRASVSILRDVMIKTMGLLPLREPQTLFLVHPWIHDLLDPLASVLDPYTRALWLIARLGLKFNALLFQQQPYNGYKRVATDHEIAVQLPRITSAQDICTTVLDVWDSHVGLR